ncbi:DUF2478 domain-containing protein [Thalassococcus sp. CAU 1522]|uniref:DUF2478 domain-containing protein n=1 Tax=Thalassococcus arenae TaxID=2851652 RepID=A0ABS6NCB2_9RHOB|nr:DUF2478 domain-containing protein [Thalassococcus arenae]MBV2361628.1 DUF2478 domain-containing protein [Thalassococcus arenae]
MGFAYVSSEDRGAVDKLLAAFAERCLADGVAVTGIVQTNTPRPKSHRCDMDVRVLPDGPVIRISQDLGPEATGCALNPAALESAVLEVERRLSGDSAVLIVNKFGKHEAEGKGFRDLIAEAHALDVPVVVGLNGLNAAAFQAFAGGLAEQVPADLDALADWLARSRATAQDVA